MENRIVRVALHILGCIVVLSVPILSMDPHTLDKGLFVLGPFQGDLLFHILLIAFFYALHFLLVPKLFLTKKYFSFLAIVVFFFFLIELFFRLFFSHQGPTPNEFVPAIDQIPTPNFDLHNPKPPRFRNFIINLIEYIAVIIFSLLLKINEKWKKAEKEKLSVELSYLKAQINPHFLFNTLNSIYSLAITKSDGTADAVVKLSEMMRYVTTEAHNEFVDLEKELNYIKNYIDLQKLRLGNTVEVQFEMKGFSKFKKITPLVIIPFVENAFKYGVNPEEDSYIRIFISVDEKNLELKIINKKVDIQYSKESHSGHGIANASRRLEFSYPGKHTLIIKDEKKEYSVSLKLIL